MCFETIFPECVSCVYVRTFVDIEPLFPEELELVLGASDKRTLEFTAGRHCARRALVEQSQEAQPILATIDGAPIWPAEIVGSITHCDGLVAACVAHKTKILAIGIDAEPALPLPRGVEDIALTLKERKWIARSDPDTPWDRIHFCAKEAFYKAWYPLEKRILEPLEIEITFDVSRMSYVARVDAKFDFPIKQLVGRLCLLDGYILANAYVMSEKHSA